MTPKKKQPAKRGRKPKPSGDRLEQLTIRLSPKLKFGLELLSRAQGRTLSQAVEWALQVGLNNFRVNNDWDSVAKLMEDAWSKTTDFDRAWKIYSAAPTLVEFEDRAGCELVENSAEHGLALEPPQVRAPKADLAKLSSNQAIAEGLYRRNLVTERTNIYFNFVRHHWPAIRKIATENISMGRLPRGGMLLHAVGYPVSGHDEFAQMQTLTEVAEGSLAQDKLMHRIVELEHQFPWSTGRHRK